MGDVATLAKWYNEVKKNFIVQCRQQRGTRLGPPPNLPPPSQISVSYMAIIVMIDKPQDV